MIIVNLVGGLGNQMFQYACGRAQALELNMPLKAMVDMFGMYPGRNGPELDRVFALQLELAQQTDLRKMIGAFRVSPAVRRVLATKALAPIRGRHFISEPHGGPAKSLVDKVRKGGYLQGYWQSERYFLKYEEAIRRDFTFRHSVTGHNVQLARMILNAVAVSVHVRRGDYVSNPAAFAVHGTCAPEYYYRAIESVRRRLPSARLFAFSDDPKWVRDVLIPRYPDLVLVDHNRHEDSYNDMRLMSLCRHHVISNSSFSWWAAWLNSCSDKIVIAPRKWLANGAATDDLIPRTWERM
jgi:hypothetical protein